MHLLPSIFKFSISPISAAEGEIPKGLLLPQSENQNGAFNDTEQSKLLLVS